MGRYASGHGQGMGGKDKHSRTGGMQGLPTDMLSPLGKGLVAREEKERLRKIAERTKPPKPAGPSSPPARDPGAMRKYAHMGELTEHVFGTRKAPDIYEEKPGGRRGMRGKRGA